MVYDIVLGRNLTDRSKFGTRGTIFLGKSYVQMGPAFALSNRILIDVASSHVILVSGKRGSGKSYNLSVMAEEIAMQPEAIAKNLSVIMLDTMGIFWTMRYPNIRDEKLLDEWGLKPRSMNVKIYVPSGFFDEHKRRGIPVDYSFTIRTSELSALDWCSIFDIKITDVLGVLIESSLEELRETALSDYDISDIIKVIMKNKRVLLQIKDAAINRFLNAQRWKLFEKEGISISDLVRRGEIVVLDLSAYSEVSSGWNIKQLVVSIIARNLLKERTVSRKFEEREDIEHHDSMFIDTEKELEKPLVWLMIDEAHNFVPREGENIATEPLVRLLKERRQPGISLVLATQQPGEVKKDVLTQSDIVISHRLTAKADIDALNSMMQNYLLEDIQTFMNHLPRLQGSAIILDDNSERIYPMRVRPKLSWHGGESPSAIKYDKKEEIEKMLGFELK